jgi:hypothetical protein
MKSSLGIFLEFSCRLAGGFALAAIMPHGLGASKPRRDAGRHACSRYFRLAEWIYRLVWFGGFILRDALFACSSG